MKANACTTTVGVGTNHKICFVSPSVFSRRACEHGREKFDYRCTYMLTHTCILCTRPFLFLRSNVSMEGMTYKTEGHWQHARLVIKLSILLNNSVHIFQHTVASSFSMFCMSNSEQAVHCFLRPL